ncbi:MAG: response regulator [Syntrophorhabdales bacterium]|jgi:CheY-like chemotaxis protein
MSRQPRVEESTPYHVEICNLLGRQLKRPLVVVVEPTHPGFAAYVAGIPVFGYGDDAAEAMKVLKEGIEGICQNEESLDLRATIQRMFLLDDLMEDEERISTGQVLLPLRKCTIAKSRYNTYSIKMIKKKILLIDDESMTLDVLSAMLMKMNYEVTAEESAANAVKIFTEDPGKFDLVLTDLMMPEMSGDSLSEHIHSLRPDIPVVLITGFPGKVSRERVAAAGIRKVLIKGMTRRELSAALQEVL